MINPERQMSYRKIDDQSIIDYFNEIETKYRFADYQDAAKDMLTVSTFYENDTQALNFIGMVVRPAKTNDAKDVQRMKDEFIVLPIKAISPYIEPTMKLAETLGWYESVVKSIMEKSGHGSKCLKPHDASMVCELSTSCPWRDMAYSLTDGVVNPDFEDSEYEIYGPAVRREIVRGKFDLAVRLHLFKGTYYQGIMSAYDTLYTKEFPTDTSNT